MRRRLGGVAALALAVVMLASSCFSIELSAGSLGTIDQLTYPAGAGAVTDWLWGGISAADAEAFFQHQKDAGELIGVHAGDQLDLWLSVCFPDVPAGAYPRKYLSGHDSNAVPQWLYSYTTHSGCTYKVQAASEMYGNASVGGPYTFAVAYPGETFGVELDYTTFVAPSRPVAKTATVNMNMFVANADKSSVWYKF